MNGTLIKKGTTGLIYSCFLIQIFRGSSYLHDTLIKLVLLDVQDMHREDWNETDSRDIAFRYSLILFVEQSLSPGCRNTVYPGGSPIYFNRRTNRPRL